jgi:quercetin dioxygenase-like cupin family protein
MKIYHYKEIEAKEVPSPAEKVKVRWLISEEMGVPNFSMRQFIVEPSGSTPKHTHPWEHEVYVLSGSGTVLGGNEESICKAGSVVYIPPNELHQFKNTCNEDLIFLCLIPHPED